MLKLEDFCYFSQRKQLADLKEEDAHLLQAIDQRSQKNDRALLLIHGFTSSPAVFRYLIPEVHSYDAIVCPVLPGHAQSIDYFAKSTAEQWLAMARQQCKELLNEYQQVDVLGLSLGGLLALSLSYELPIHHLFLLAPACRLILPTTLLLMQGYVLKTLGIQSVSSRGGNLVNTARSEITYKKIPVSVAFELLRYIHSQQWKAPSCPVDLFLGRYDRVVSSPKVAQLFAEDEQVNIHWLEHSAHVLSLDNDLAQIASVLNQ